MTKLRSQEFTAENLRNYANACMTLAWDLPQYKFDTLLLPSRGAVPVFLGTVAALKYLGKEDKVYRDLLDRMTAPLTVKSGIIPKAKERERREDDIKILPYPLTADINVTRHEKGASNDYFSEGIRKFSANVIKSFFQDPHQRIDDNYFRFLYDILTKIEGREKLALEYATYPKTENMAIVDTAISGRAASTILNALGEEGIFPQTFLIVDRNGEKVRKDFQKQLGYKIPENGEGNIQYEKKLGRTVKKEISIDRRKIKFYDVNRVVTEDTGSALQGVSATLYPNLIMEGHSKLFPALKNVGAGTWHAIPRERSHRKIFYHFINTLKAAVNLECSELYGREKEISNREELFEGRRRKLINMLEETELPEIDINNISRHYPEYDLSTVKDVYESSAQVLHLVFNTEFTDNFLEDFRKEIGLDSPKNGSTLVDKLA